MIAWSEPRLFTPDIESDCKPWIQCRWASRIETTRFAGEHRCELTAGHDGGHSDGTLRWYGGFVSGYPEGLSKSEYDELLRKEEKK